MTDSSSPDVPETRAPRSRRGSGRGRRIGAVVVGLTLVLVATLYLNRRAATQQVLVGWLARQGIDADIAVEKVELDGFVARVRIGDPRAPEVEIERVEVDYVIGLPWQAGGAGLTPSRVRLLRPVARARWQNGRLSFGSLDPLIEKFAARPSRTDIPGPRILIESGRVRLTTDFGPMEMLADATVDDGRLLRLAARIPEVSLGKDETTARNLSGTLNLTTTGERVALRMDLAAGHANIPGWQGQALQLRATGELPYPDIKTRREDGAVRLDGTLTGDRLSSGQTTFAGAAVAMRFTGQGAGWTDAFRLTGHSDVDLAAGRIDGGSLDARTVAATLKAARTTVTRDPEGLTWRLDGAAGLTARRAAGVGISGTTVTARAPRLMIGGRGRAFEARGPATVTAARATWADLDLNALRGSLDLDLVQDTGVRFEATGSLRATRGAWPLFGSPARDDVPELAEMKRALSAFALDAPGLSLTAGDSGVRLVMDRPVRIIPANGGVLTLEPVARPVYAAPQGQVGGGALSLTATRGRGLPEANFAVPAWTLTPGGFSATLDGRAALDFGLARGVALRTRGVLASGHGRVTYTASDCVTATVERLELDQNDVTGLSGKVCPGTGPMVTIADGRWRAGGAITGFSAAAPFLAMDFAGIEGGLVATGGPAGLGLEARIDQSRVGDTTMPRRFNPVAARGRARLAGQDWTGAFDLSQGPHALGRLTLAHDGSAGTGGIDIVAPNLTFAEGGLQPDDLSPMVTGLLGPPVTGSVSFTGRIDWAADREGSSSGLLTVPNLDFNSPAGPVKGLKGEIAFISLTPLVTAPGQVLTAERLDTVSALTDLDLTFGLDAAAITVSGGELAVGGGIIRVEPFVVSLDRTQPFEGIIVLENVQLGDVIAGAGFGDTVQMDAVVSGRLPFISDPVRGVRVTGGSLFAVQPGRLSIQRQALTGLKAGGGGEVPTGTVEDLAYQAMENLAFDVLTAEVNTLKEGRLAVLFHIRGRHDPPQHQEIRLSVAELIRREFLNEDLTLPSDTGIDLTLDTTLNINQLVRDLMDLNVARRGGTPVPTPR